MKIAFLTTRLDKPSTRYRVLQYLPLLKERGFDCEIKIFPKRFFQKLGFYESLSGFDAVFLQRKLLNALDFWLLRKNARRLVFDFDDALIYKDSNQKVVLSRKNEVLFERTVKKCDQVIAGNKTLYNMAAPFNPNTCVIPTPVDMSRYIQRTFEPEKEKITLGWIGTASTLIYLKNVLPALEQLQDKYGNIELKIVADAFFDSEKIPVIRKPWNFEEEISDLHSFDIGLMPLTDDLWSKGKCGLKLLQYMACGIAPVCSPVGVNAEIVDPGKNGFHATSLEEWYSRLETLLSSRELRISMGGLAREKAQAFYSTKANVESLIKTFYP